MLLKNTCLKAFILIVWFPVWGISIAGAQRLPKIQNEGMRALANIKIDGMANEWGDNFKANNPDNRMLYSMANDDKNLYLIIKMDSDIYTFIKALNGGVSLRILTNDKEKDILKSVIYPAIDDRKEAIVDFTHDAKKFRSKHNATGLKALDSISRLANQAIKENYKNIEIVRYAGQEPEYISIYNAEGIRVAGRFNNRMEYFVEMAIPLKFLNIEPGQKLTYSLALIGTYERFKRKTRKTTPQDLAWIPENARFQALTSSFSGIYPVVK